jgi:hypothetical protein
MMMHPFRVVFLSSMFPKNSLKLISGMSNQRPSTDAKIDGFNIFWPNHRHATGWCQSIVIG